MLWVARAAAGLRVWLWRTWSVCASEEVLDSTARQLQVEEDSRRCALTRSGAR
jgi:hypothetical protein